VEHRVVPLISATLPAPRRCTGWQEPTGAPRHGTISCRKAAPPTHTHSSLLSFCLQVESLGARFLTLKADESTSGGGGYAKEMSDAFLARELALFEAQAKEVDVIIT
jgi:hypothetical protein